MGVLDAMLAVFARKADLEWLMIDSTIVHAPVARRRGPQGKGRADVQGLGRSRGGLTTKIHAATEVLGLPVRLIATPGLRSDIASAHDLVGRIKPGALLADEGYDADHLIENDEGAENKLSRKRHRLLASMVVRCLSVERYNLANWLRTSVK